MEVVLWNKGVETNETSADVARLLAARLGDTVHELPRGPCHEPAPTSASGSGTPRPRAEGGGPAPADTATLPQAVEACIEELMTAEGVRMVVIPVTPASAAPLSLLRRVGALEEIALRVPVPTLALQNPAGLREWAQGQRPLRVLLAHDLSGPADDALEVLRAFIDAGPCRLVVVHVHQPKEACARLGLGRPPSKEDKTQLEFILHRELQDRAQRILGGRPAEIRLSGSDHEHDQAVLELVQQEPFDLVVVGTRQRRGLDRLGHATSLARSLLRAAPVNVLVVPPARELPAVSRVAISRVLVATDLTWLSNQAISHGYALLPQSGTLRLLHVTHPRALPQGEYDDSISRQLHRSEHREVLHSCQARLRALALRNGSAPGVKTEIEVVEHTEPAVAIAQAAARFGADVVVMAAHQPDHLLNRVFRTCIHEVMAKSRRPLLVIPTAQS